MLKVCGILNVEGVETTTYRACVIKARLLAHFGNALIFHRPKQRNVCEYVLSSSLSPGPLVEKCAAAVAALTQILSEPADHTVEQETRESHHQQNLTRDMY